MVKTRPREPSICGSREIQGYFFQWAFVVTLKKKVSKPWQPNVFFSNVPSALIRLFTQAISETASHLTSYTLHFFSYILYPFSPHAVLPGYCCTCSWRLMSHCWNLRSKTRREAANSSSQNVTLSLSSCLKTLSLQKFQPQGLGPASTGTVSKEHCLFLKNGGDKSPRGVLPIHSLPPPSLSLSQLFLSRIVKPL